MVSIEMGTMIVTELESVGRNAVNDVYVRNDTSVK
jgi:hypothetical protein